MTLPISFNLPDSYVFFSQSLWSTESINCFIIVSWQKEVCSPANTEPRAELKYRLSLPVLL